MSYFARATALLIRELWFAWPRWFRVLISGFLLLRLYVMAVVPPFDDEAYYWTWTKELSYSYYDHPGMVAWILYPFSWITQESAFFIRIPALVCFLGIVLCLFYLGKKLFSKQAGALASGVVFFIPLFGFAGIGTLPDSPMILIWMLVAVVFLKSLSEDSEAWSPRKTWLCIGVLMGLGMNSKLTSCLIGLGLGLFLVFSSKHRKQLTTPWPWVGMLTTFLMMAPIFVWNAQHDWASFVYHFGRRHSEGAGIDWNRWGQFMALQAVFISPGVFISILFTLLYSVRQAWSDWRWRFFLCLPLPTILIFYYQALVSTYKPHWAGPAYLLILPATAALWLSGVQYRGRFLIAKQSPWVAGTSVTFLFVLNLMWIPLLTPVIPQVHAWLKPNQTWNPLWDFSNEFYGWKEVGARVRQIQLDQADSSGPLPAGSYRYELISQLMWGTGGKVWHISRDTDQFAFDQTLATKVPLLGRKLILVDNDKYPWEPHQYAKVDTCTKENFDVYRGSFKARTFFIWVCDNFQGVKWP